MAVTIITWKSYNDGEILGDFDVDVVANDTNIFPPLKYFESHIRYRLEPNDQQEEKQSSQSCPPWCDTFMHTDRA